MSQSSNLDEARRARLAGAYGRAELICREIIDKNPIDALALGLLGQCLAEAGDPRAAAHFIELALSLAPAQPEIRLNAAALREAEGDLEGALKEAEEAVRLAPGKFEAQATLGKLFGQAGDYRRAAEALSTAARLNPRHPGAALLLAGALAEIGDDKGAERALGLLGERAGSSPEALRLRAHLAQRRGDWPRLVEAATRLLSASPQDEEARAALAFGLAAQGYYDDATQAYRPLAEREPRQARHRAALGRYRLGARDLDGARRYFEQAAALDASFAEPHYGFARIKTALGDLAGAEEAARRAITLDPTLAEAFAQLVEVTNGRLDEVEFAALKRLAANQHQGADKRIIAGFALGEALHRRQEYDAAFAAWSEANALQAEMLRRAPDGGYKAALQAKTTNLLKTLFPSDGTSPTDAPARRPIFIVGMPRSGTSLLEAALSAHPDVSGCGEIPALPFILKEFLAWAREAGETSTLPAEKIAAWRTLYFRQARKYGADDNAPFFTDKQPLNFMAIGLIRRLFPDAAIIHIRRNPVETGLSIYRRNFSEQWPFACDLDSIGRFYGQYAELMRHWEQTHGETFAFVQYEQLVGAFEDELRRLVEYCGLSWDKACLEFPSAARPMMTFSAAQVRKPASKNHLGAAKAYENHLAPLREALSRAGVDLETGSLASDR